MRLLPAAFAVFALLAAPAGAQTIYTVDFDSTADSTTTAPFVGSGTIAIGNDPGADGTFAYSALGTVTFSFTFPALGLTFTNAQISTPTNQILFRSRTRMRSAVGPSAGPSTLGISAPACRFNRPDRRRAPGWTSSPS
ncbi:MAG: hypothetical protein JSR82_21805 [Verrucomicrobia bacterium]|nr:hypothetical protein [Verrucomicrobiota bacterium]